MLQFAAVLRRGAPLLAPLILFAAPLHAQVVIAEFMADNSDTLLDSDGESSDWIELHNTSGASVLLAGWRLTDDPAGLSSWTFPSVYLAIDERLVVFASGEASYGSELHTNFKLSAEGEYLALVPASGGAPSSEFSPAYPEQLEDVSFGLSGTGSLGYLSEPTPGAPNTDEFHPARDVDFDLERGFFDAPILVTLTCEEAEPEIRYTVDGSEPSAVHGTIYTAPLTLSNTACLRAIALVGGMAPSRVSTRTYLFIADVLAQDQAGAVAAGFPAEWIEQDGTPWTAYFNGTHPGAWYGFEQAQLSLHSEAELHEALLAIPSVSLVMSIDDWFGYHPPAGPFGIYANLPLEGDEWERAASMEWIDPGTGSGFQINCGLGMQGGSGSSITWASQASMQVKFKKEYGPGKLEHPLFVDSACEVFDALILDAGNQNSIHANCGWQTKRRAQGMRDQFMMDLQRSVGQPSASGRHVHVFLNGLYWGLYNLHEKPNDDWAANQEGGEPEEYDWVKEGAVYAGNFHPHDHATTPGSWATAIEIASGGLGASDQWGGVPSYDALQEHIDVANYADYMLINFYGGNLDWPSHNWHATSHARNSDLFGDVDPDGSFRIHSWDAETTLNWNGVTAVDDGWYDRTYVGDTDNEQSAAYMYGRLVEHPEFVMLLADRMQRMRAPAGALHVEPGAEVRGTPFAHGQSAAADLYYHRSSEIEVAVRLEFARWANFFDSSGGASPVDWEIERTRLYEEYFTVRTDVLVEQLRAATPPVFPTIDAPYLSQHGGQVEAGFQLVITTTAGEVYLSLDGSDPRLEGGAIAAGASLYSGPIPIDGGLIVVKARALVAGEWSALTEAVFSQIRINELMAKNQSGATDEQGEFEDWIELHNGSSQRADLSGWFLSDRELIPRAWEFPSGVSLGAGESMLLWADGDEAAGPLHTSFRLSDGGESVYLSAPLEEGVLIVDSVVFGAQAVDRSIGRLPSGGGVFVDLIDPSPGSLNEPMPGEAVRFAALGAADLGASLEATGLPFTGQVVSVFVQGLSAGGLCQLRVGLAVEAEEELIGERLGAIELDFQADGAGAASLAVLLPRLASGLRPSPAVPLGTVFYLQATSRSGSTHGLAVCVQN
jgi:hypothetical protein